MSLHNGILVFLIPFLFATSAAVALPTFDPDHDPSMAAFITKHGLERSVDPYVRMSEVLKPLPKEQRRDFVKKIISVFLGGATLPETIHSLLHASFGIKIEDEKTLKALSRSEDQAVNDLIELIFVKADLDNHPERIDYFPTVPIEDLGKIQQALFSAGTPNPNPPPARPFKLTYPPEEWQDIVIKTSGCPRLKRSRGTIVKQYGLVDGMEPIHAYTVDCYQQNSASLAKLMNLLSNTINGEKVRARLRWEKAPGKEHWVTSYPQLLAALGDFGFTVELYNTRVLVDFLGWSHFDGKKYSAIRAATWFRLPIGHNERVRAPAEHGELDLLIRLGAERIAGLQWFFGIPKPEYRGVATFWRPHLYLQAPWAKYINEIVKVFSPERTEAITPWLESTAHVMRGFQAVYDRFQPPLNAYGLFICSDSLTLALAKYFGLMEAPLKGDRVTNAFPTLYARTLTLISKTAPPQTVDLHEILARNAGIDLNFLDAAAKTDPEVAEDPRAMRRRLAQTFDPRDDHRLESFQEFMYGDLRRIRQ